MPTRNTDFFLNMTFDYEIKVSTVKGDSDFWPCQVNFEHGDLKAEV